MTDTLYPHDQLIKWVNKEIDRESPWGFTTFCIIFWLVNTCNVLFMTITFNEILNQNPFEVSPIVTIGLNVAGYLLIALMVYAAMSIIIDVGNAICRRVAIDP